MKSRLLIVLVSLAFLAGCGGGSAGETSATNTSTAATTSDKSNGLIKGTPADQRPIYGVKTGFLGEANALCQQNLAAMQRKLAPYLSRAVTKGINEPGKVVNAVIAPGLETEIRELRALKTPTQYEAKMNAVFVASEEMIAEAKGDPKAFMEDGTPYVKAENVARPIGLVECGHP